MNKKLEAFRAAGLRAAEFQLRRQQPDGSFIWEGFVKDAYHKQAYSWAVAGHLAAAHRLLTWVKRNTQLPDGQLRGYGGDVYKQAWFFQGAHRLGRFDLSYPTMRFLLSCEAPCGGYPHFAGDPWTRSLATAWVGVGAVYLGRLDVAERVAECCVRMLEQQPDPQRFYYRTTLDGQLATPDIDPEALYIDLTALNQPYWEVALPWMLMGRLYQATGEKRYLDLAERFFEVKLRCAEDAFANVGSGKSGLAAAIHYLNTGDERARDAAYRFGEFLLETQVPEGGWRGETEPDILLIYLDHAAEYNIWLQEIVAILNSLE
jgi:hypothetical protein